MNYYQTLNRLLLDDEVDYNFEQLRARYITLTGENMTIKLRRELNRPLTNKEMDANFASLDQALMRLQYGDGPYPVMDSVFAGASFLDSRITFSRPWPSTYIENGVLKTAAANVPVFEDGAWRLRPQETNIVSKSVDLSAVYLSNTNVTFVSSAMTGPDGIKTMMRLSETAVTGLHRILLSMPIWSMTGGAKYTITTFHKADEREGVYFNYTAALGLSAYVNLRTGAIVNGAGTVAKYTRLANGLCRVDVTGTVRATLTTSSAYMQIQNSATAPVDDSYAGVEGYGLYVSDIQINTGDPIPYIPTTSSQVTRPADDASIQGTAFAEIFNPVEGAIALEADFGRWASDATLQDVPFVIKPANDASSFIFLSPRGGASNDFQVGIFESGPGGLVYSTIFTATDRRVRLAIGYDHLGIKVAANGIALGGTAEKFRMSWDLLQLRGPAYLKRLRAFRTRPSDEFLEAMTA